MVLSVLIAVLLIEQVWPLPYRSVVHEPLLRLAGFLETFIGGGDHRQGMIAWMVGVGGLTLASLLVHSALRAINPLLAWPWDVLVLYLTLGFRQFSHYYTHIQLALRMDDLPHARALLAEWCGDPGDRLSRAEIARLAIEQALEASHRHVFGVLVCFVLLPGPAGAVLYRSAALFAEVWGERGPSDSAPIGNFSRRVYALIDWLPLRMTAASFAVVGNFEAAVACWRSWADTWPESRLGSRVGVVLASASGALGVRLGPFAADGGHDRERVESGQDRLREETDVDVMKRAVGLVWRALLLWLLLLLLLGFSGMAGN